MFFFGGTTQLYGGLFLIDYKDTYRGLVLLLQGWFADTQHFCTKVHDFLSMDLPIAKHEELFANGKLSRRKSDDYCVSTKVLLKRNVGFSGSFNCSSKFYVTVCWLLFFIADCYYILCFFMIYYFLESTAQFPTKQILEPLVPDIRQSILDFLKVTSLVTDLYTSPR